MANNFEIKNNTVICDVYFTNEAVVQKVKNHNYYAVPILVPQVVDFDGDIKVLKKTAIKYLFLSRESNGGVKPIR